MALRQSGIRSAWVLAAAFAAGVGLLVVVPGATIVLLGGALLWALRSPAAAIQSLAITTLVSYANPALLTLSSSSGLLVRATLLAAALRVLPTLRIPDLGLLWPAWLFVAIALPTSFVASPAVEVSMMKIAIFFIATTTILTACNHLSVPSLLRLRTWLATLLLTVIALSAVTALRPAIGFNLTSTGLQGLMSHPQTLAILTAPVAAALVAGAVLMRDRPIAIELTLAALCLAVMYLTEARTAAVSTTTAVVLAGLTRLARRRTAEQAGAGRPLLLFAAAGITLTFAAIATDAVGTTAMRFLLKRGSESSVAEAFEASRGSGVVAQWQNFVAKPLTGNGFGVYADGEFPSGVVEFMGIPISAPVEKGFAPTAVLEETGLFGFAAFVLMVFALGRRAWRSTDLRTIAAFVAAIMVNVGECLLTAPGGVGLMVWIVVGLTACAGRVRRARAAVAPRPFAIPAGDAAASPAGS